MSDFSDVLSPEAVQANLAAVSKKALFQQLGGIAASAYGLDAKRVADALVQREKLGSTGFGNGTAIPHARVEGLDGIVAAVARLAQPLDYQAVDALPVDIVFMLLSPPEAGADHLKTLARVSRGLRDDGFVAKLRGAGSHDAMYVLLTDDSRNAA